VAALPDSIEVLVQHLDECFHGPAWHGPSLAGALRAVDAHEAAWRPARERHSIWELALHTAYWKYIVRRRISGGVKRGAFPRKGSNFPALPPQLDDQAWQADQALLEEQHALLRIAVAALGPTDLERTPGASRSTVRQSVLGVAAHDVYHAGQIQLLKKLRRVG
jgi:uncharacterized damage-inducible protein DinB